MLCRFEDGQLTVSNTTGSVIHRIDLRAFQQVSDILLDRAGEKLLLNAWPAGKAPAEATRGPLFIMNLRVGSWRCLYDGPSADATWLPDQFAVAFATGIPAVATVQPDGSGLKQHFSNPKLGYWFTQLRASPNAKRLSFEQRKGGSTQLIVVRLEGGESLVFPCRNCRGHTWIDDERILFDNSQDLYALDLATGKKKLWLRDARLPMRFCDRVYFLRGRHELSSSALSDDGITQHAVTELDVVGYALLNGGETFALTYEQRNQGGVGQVVERGVRYFGRADGIPAGYFPLSKAGRQPLHWLFKLPWQLRV